MKWINVKDEMPPPNKYVLAFDGRAIIRACWTPEFSDPNCDEDNYDYRESDHTYWVPEGWYEGMNHWDTYSSVKIGTEITHWMALPAKPYGNAK